MATASVTNTFVNAQVADATEVNTNFTNLVTFLNASVVHVDGSKAMSGALAMGSNKITGLAAGSAAGDALRYEQRIEDVATTKGDILAATAADTLTRLGVGANDTVLTADSTEATGLKWGAAGQGLTRGIANISGVYIWPDGATTDSVTTYTWVGGVGLFCPITLPACTISSLSVGFHASTTNDIKMAIFSAGSDGLPGTLIEEVEKTATIDIGTNDLAVSGGTRALTAGLYWIAVLGSGSIGVYNAYQGNSQIGDSNMHTGSAYAHLDSTITYATGFASSPTMAIPGETGAGIPAIGVKIN